MSLSTIIKPGAFALAISSMACAAFAQPAATQSGAHAMPSVEPQGPIIAFFATHGPRDVYPGATGDTRLARHVDVSAPTVAANDR